MIKNLSLAAFALAISTGVAFAADTVVGEPAPISGASLFDWSGAYIGANLGYVGGKAKHPFSVTDMTTTPPTSIFGGSLNLNSSGFVGGIQAGYNWQSDSMVYGVEADFQDSGVKAEGSASFSDGFNNFDARAGTKLNWFGTVRARVGFAATDRFLVYGTGGLAYGQTKSFVDVSTNGVSSISESAKKTKAGWTVGGGTEYAVTDNWTFKTEYLYTDLGKANLISADFQGVNASLDRKFNFHTVRAGINYKF